MPRRAHLPTLGLAVLAIAAACDGDSPGTPNQAPPLPRVDPAPPTPPPYTHRPGPAYLGIDNAGLFELEDGKLTRLVEHPFPFQQIVVTDEGVVYAAAIGGLWRIDPAHRRSRIDDDLGLPFQTLALGPDGVLWGTDQRDVARYDGAWTREPTSTFDDELIHDLAVDLDGRVWVVTSQELWRLDGDRWNQLDPSFAPHRPAHFRALAVGTDGAVYVSSLGGTSVFRDGRWTAGVLSTGGVSGMLDEIVVGPAGHVAGSGNVDTLVVAAPGEPVRRTDLADGPARAARGEVRAVDGAGRVWLTTDNGLVILDDLGDLVQQWEPGTVDGIAGSVTALAIVADGPTLPAQRPQRTGTVTGVVYRSGKAVSRATVQACELPHIVVDATSTPCGHATVARQATSGADGRFRLERVPVGSYGFAVKIDGRWRNVFDLDGANNCCSQLESTGNHDIGPLVVN